jgi:dTDP-4-amino-4,6-dideoxygalactose transaminase
MNKKIAQYGDHFIDDKDIKSVNKVLRGNFLTTGPQVNLFEKMFSEKVGVKYSLSCANGTVALHLSLKALEVGKDDFVIVPNITFFASVSAVIMSGAKPLLCDVNPDDGLINKDSLRLLLKRYGYNKIKAVIIVHLNGKIVDISNLIKITKKIPIIEDSCHALGGAKKGKNFFFRVGSCHKSTLATFSFHPVKNITTGEGGMVTTNKKILYQKLTLLRNHHLERFPTNSVNFPYEINNLGYNYRLSDINCALGVSQLKKLHIFKKYRLKLVNRYKKNLLYFKDFIKFIPNNSDDDIFWHLNVLLIDFKKIKLTRAKVMIALKEKGIGSQIHYKPINNFKYIKESFKENSSHEYIGSQKYFKKIITLPLHYNLKITDVDYICKTLIDILNLKKNK